MFRLLVLVSLVGFGLSADDSFDDLPVLGVVGGRPTTIDRFPHQISLEYKNRHNCGGTIYKPNVIITAAHCVHGLSAADMTVRAGSTITEQGGHVVRVAHFIVYPYYDPRNMNHDVAILFLAQQLPMGNNVKAISLVPHGQAVPVKQTAVVSGWGLTSENGQGSKNLQTLDMPIWNTQDCAMAYMQQGLTVTDAMVCAGFTAGGKSTCQGDSGGPLIHNNKLFGIVSWGVGCARPNTPGVYANVAFFTNWIDQTCRSYGY